MQSPKRSQVEKCQGRIYLLEMNDVHRISLPANIPSGLSTCILEPCGGNFFLAELNTNLSQTLLLTLETLFTPSLLQSWRQE